MGIQKDTLKPAAQARREKAMRYLRFFLMDTPELNLLLKDYETSPERLEFCLDMAISDWNSTAPILRAVDIMSYPSLYLLMHGAAIQALTGAGLFHTRNSIAYQAGGSSFQRFGKSQEYMAWIQMFKNDYEQKKKDFKYTQNIEAAWGNHGVFSEYYKMSMW
jgi:hypothetical protein